MTMTTQRKIKHWINGRAEAGASNRHGTVFNPATGEAAATVPMANEAEVAAAITAASDVFPDWAATPPIRPACLSDHWPR
jgi:malonate-semialdehyde dehydrogenase (acetylating)/methylmalonate-semialdehyde dehydrogenase